MLELDLQSDRSWMPIRLSELLDQAIELDRAVKETRQIFEPETDSLKIIAHRGFDERFLHHFETVKRSIRRRLLKTGASTDLLNSGLNRISTLDDLNQQGGDGQKQKDMDKASQCVRRDHSQEPQNHQQNKDCPEHGTPPYQLSACLTRRRADRNTNDISRHNHFDSTVALTPISSIVGSDWHRLSKAARSNRV